MKLLDIEISGFKSFANSVRIPIDKDLIGFVGPNGCGKSNIVDAIKWVIGEQSPKEIRCEKSGDVIFNGSTLRAAQGMAEVTLRLSNEDRIIPLNYSEIEITRRLYKNGDSEYLLNRTPVRLKDINRFLSGTGLGESSYTLFKPSVIDDLLRSNSMLINDILCEASGIAKYKLDKRETLKKLALTRDAMKRGEDIIAEVSERLRVLKYQADKVRRYNKLKEDIENKEKLFFMSSYKSLREELHSIYAKIEECKNRELEKIKKLSDFEKIKKEYNEKIIKISDMREAVSQSINSINEQLNKIIGEKSTVLAELKNLQERSKGLLREKIELSEQIPKTEEKLSSVGQRTNETEKQIVNLEKEIKVLGKQTDDITKKIVYRSTELDIKKKEFEEKKSSLHDIENEMAVEKRTYQFDLDKLNDLKDELDSNIEESRKIKEQTPFLEDKLAEYLTKEKNLKEEVKKLKDKLVKTNSDIEKSKDELRETENSLGRMKSELGILKEMEENGEGIGEEALKFRNSGKPLLMDRVEVKQGYENLIENLLSNYKDTVLLNNKEEVADLLKKVVSDKKNGRINFVYKKVEKPNSDVGSVISDGKGYLPAFIEDTRIVNSIDNINFNSGMPQITKDGKVYFYRNFISVGGSGRVKFIGRKRQIEEIEKSVKEKEGRLDNLKKTINDLIENQENLLNRINEEDERAVKLSEEITGIEEKIRIENGKINLLNTEIEDIREEIAEYSVNVDDIKLKIKELENAVSVAREEIPVIDTYEEELREMRMKLDTLNKKTQERLLEKVRKDNEFENAKKLTEEIEEKIKSTKGKTAKIEERLKEFTVEIEEKKKSIEEYEKREKELRGNIEKFREAYGKYRNDIINFREEIEVKQKDIAVINKELETIRREIEEYKIKRESVSVKIDEIVIKLRNRYGMDAEKSDFETGEKILGVEEIERLKNRLAKMEPINLLALKEYNEVKERLEFLIKQKEDLVESEKSLLKTIEISDKRAIEDFEKNFDIVKENFNKIFIEVFGGGKSNIVIEDGQNPIESKITIYAQPPGKRIKTITMLSTGEQTLAAIALLFAIYETKPSPFCFMDEIDAPLDDANVERFLTLLKRLKNKSQILMITHNRRTMEICEYIYGVTMEEGISKVISINLQKEMEEWV